jgi:heat shock protein
MPFRENPVDLCYLFYLQVLAKSFDHNLGGRNFDFRLTDYFSQEFQKKYKIAVQGHPKRFLRLLNEVEKLKKMMSTVTTPVPLNLECFADDRDVSGTIKRCLYY